MQTKSAVTRLFAPLLACVLLSNAWADEYDVDFDGKWFNVTGSDNFVGKMRISGAINATATTNRPSNQPIAPSPSSKDASSVGADPYKLNTIWSRNGRS